jgi:hypothetical protein
MIKALRMLFIAAAAMVVLAPQANAGNSFSISPPPIAAPTFEEGKTDGKVRFTYVSLSGNGMDFSGGGIDGIGRKAFSNSFAGDVQGGVFFLSGDIDTGGSAKSSTTFVNMLFSANGELQAYKGDVFSMLLFAGPNLNFMAGSMDIPCPIGTCTDTATITGSLYGLQAGVQFGIKAGDFHIDPFAMIMSQQGSTTVSTSFGDTTVTIDPYTTTSFGLDITYTPWNMSFSAILQEAAKQNEDEEGIKTHIYQLSWHF